MMEASPIPEQLHGCRFIKVKHRDKVAIEPKWQTERNYAFDDAEILQHIESSGNYGVMVRGGICCLDADDHAAVKWTGLLKPLTGTFQVRRGDRAHYYFRCDELPAEKFVLTLNGEQIGDVRGSGGSFYQVGPGCTHPSGDVYTLVDPDAPIKRIPLQDIKPILDILCKPKRQQTSDTGGRQAPGASAQTHGIFLEGNIIEGHRNDTLAKVAGFYWSRGCTHQQVLSLLRDANIERCKPPLDDDEVQQITGSITGNYPRGPARPPGRMLVQTSEQASEAQPEGDGDGIADRYPGAEILAESKTGRLMVLHGALAERLHGEILQVSFNGRLYVYDDGVYRVDDGRINRRIRDVLEYYGIRTGLINTINEVRAHLHAMDAFNESPFDRQKYMIPVQNGVIRFLPENNYQVEMIPHSPDFLFRHKLPVKYDEDADTSFILETFKQWMSEEDDNQKISNDGEEEKPEDVLYLIQIPGIAFIQLWRGAQKISYLFEGKKDAAKTTFCELLYRFFGKGAYAEVDLRRLTENRFSFAGLEGKLINIVDDLDAVPAKHLGTYKNLTGSIYHNIERKGEDSYEGIITAAHVFTCNKAPEVKDSFDTAFWSRWIYLVWSNTFDRNDDFKEQLFSDENLSAYLLLVIEGIKGMLSGQRPVKRMSEADVKDLWTSSSSDVLQFKREKCISDASAADAWISIPAFIEQYHKWCTKQGKTPVSQKMVSTTLSRSGHLTFRPGTSGKRPYAYKGMKWTDEMEPYLKPTAPDQALLTS